MTAYRLSIVLLSVACLGCAPPTETATTTSAPDEMTADETAGPFARTEAVEVRGQSTFAVTIRSPDTGCEQYADWWEVLSEEGQLIHRRVLAHSHVDEQPFTRSSGPVKVARGQVSIVRTHMHPAGYGTQALRGTISAGFEEIVLPEGFAAAVASEGPQPPPCAY